MFRQFLHNKVFHDLISKQKWGKYKQIMKKSNNLTSERLYEKSTQLYN